MVSRFLNWYSIDLPMGSVSARFLVAPDTSHAYEYGF
uniref:Uncharacterized protein n=1 Tax=Siphoviridae sp. ct6bU4 TaxID=2825344 RepID=A0A8S5VAT4_9CAUD|nr:MAG TPA: hypothetical protein [Siphoviridae sp. ct6bU4]